jgi:hypothetical protein
MAEWSLIVNKPAISIIHPARYTGIVKENARKMYGYRPILPRYRFIVNKTTVSAYIMFDMRVS